MIFGAIERALPLPTRVLSREASHGLGRNYQILIEDTPLSNLCFIAFSHDEKPVRGRLGQVLYAKSRGKRGFIRMNRRTKFCGRFRSVQSRNMCIWPIRGRKWKERRRLMADSPLLFHPPLPQFLRPHSSLGTRPNTRCYPDEESWYAVCYKMAPISLRDPKFEELAEEFVHTFTHFKVLILEP